MEPVANPPYYQEVVVLLRYVGATPLTLDEVRALLKGQPARSPYEVCLGAPIDALPEREWVQMHQLMRRQVQDVQAICAGGVVT